MKAFICIALILCSAYAVQLHSLSLQQKQKINDFMNKGSWGSLMLNLAELNMMTEGPVDQLIDAINNVVNDLQVKLQQADSDFEARTGQHNNENKRLNDEITNAKLDVSNTETFLRDVLYVQKQTLEDDIRNLNSIIESTQKYIEDQKAQRVRDRADFEQKIRDYNDAVAAVDECLGLVGQLITGGSFAEVKKARQSLLQVQNKLKKSNVENAFVKALLAITANSEFADQGALNKVAELLNKVREQLVAAIGTLTNEENAAQAAHDADMKQKESDLVQFNIDLNDRKKSLANTIENIAQNENFVVTRKQDQANFEKELEAERVAYEEATKQYEELVAEFNKELAACQEALDLLNSTEFASYIGERMGQNVVIDTAKRANAPTVN